MARSQQQSRRGSQVLLLAAALALVVLIAAGSAEAKCYSPYSSCGGNCYNLKNHKNHCGWCNHKCENKYHKYGEAYCSGGHCYEHCYPGWNYNSETKECYH